MEGGVTTESDLRRAGEAEVGCSDQQRFLLELEFVQCLANPNYLNWLAQMRQFEDTAFLNYLEYLQYWQRPEYASYIIYPHALYFLEKLQSKAFRTALSRSNVKEMIHTQQFYFWQHYRNNRLKAELQRRQGPHDDQRNPEPGDTDQS